MKKLLFALTLLTATFMGVNAQDEHTPGSGDTWRPSEGEIGLTMQVNGIAWVGANPFADPLTGNNMLWIHYMLADDMAARVGLGINSVRLHIVSENETNGVNGTGYSNEMTHNDSVIAQMNFVLSLAVEKHMGDMEKLDPYVGAGFGIGMIGKTKTSFDSEITGSDTADATNHTEITTNTTNTNGGGFGLVLNIFGGFRYFFTDHMAIGAEIGWGYGSVKLNGDNVTEGTNVYSSTVAGTTTSTETDLGAESHSTISGSGFQVGSVNSTPNNTTGTSVGLNLTWFFGN
jgi:hypothetical protein